jgi:hypothetical protein
MGENCRTPYGVIDAYYPNMHETPPASAFSPLLLICSELRSCTLSPKCARFAKSTFAIHVTNPTPRFTNPV